jgi:hypothetical protein
MITSIALVVLFPSKSINLKALSRNRRSKIIPKGEEDDEARILLEGDEEDDAFRNFLKVEGQGHG